MHNPVEILKEMVHRAVWSLTITDVAEHLNVNRKTLSKVLNGRGALRNGRTLELAFAKTLC